MNIKQVWQAALGELQLQVPRPNYETWLKNSHLLSVEDGIFVVAVPSPFIKEWLENRYLSLIKKTLVGIVGQTVDVRFVVAQVSDPPYSSCWPASALTAGSNETGSPLVIGNGQAAPAGEKTGSDLIEKAVPVQASPVALQSPPFVPTSPANSTTLASLSSPQSVGTAPGNGRTPVTSVTVTRGQPVSPLLTPGSINPRYTFSTFIVGNSNKLAHAAALAVAEGATGDYNPLFIYGGVGLGKTHLIQAIGQRAIERGLQVIYISSEIFTNDLINSIREQKQESFRSKYRNTDFLLVDDIQFIAGKEATQEEFFHTFNTLHGAGRQIVVTSDQPPKAILALQDRLRSRFEWGLIADIQPPDIETRIAILRAKGESQGLFLPAPVLEYIAHQVQYNIRELEGALNRVIAYAALNHLPLNVDVATAALSGIKTRRKEVSSEQIIAGVAAFYKLTPQDLIGAQRDKRVALARQVAMYLLREDGHCSLLQIGQLLGGRDHSTVAHGREKIAAQLNEEPQLRQEIEQIREMLYYSNGKTATSKG